MSKLFYPESKEDFTKTRFTQGTRDEAIKDMEALRVHIGSCSVVDEDAKKRHIRRVERMIRNLNRMQLTPLMKFGIATSESFDDLFARYLWDFVTFAKEYKQFVLPSNIISTVDASTDMDDLISAEEEGASVTLDKVTADEEDVRNQGGRPRSLSCGF